MHLNVSFSKTLPHIIISIFRITPNSEQFDFGVIHRTSTTLNLIASNPQECLILQKPFQIVLSSTHGIRDVLVTKFCDYSLQFSFYVRLICTSILRLFCCFDIMFISHHVVSLWISIQLSKTIGSRLSVNQMSKMCISMLFFQHCF